ncbi:uncharacterized protein LOC126264376 [Aethina tumida]|uniref:uncharacterized protein LOC126264376 n=1 Tax=Aethina tumida TaxID=116153 RepID=UPI0021484FAE|nr:uncharacterized protein LOC126264376 [Aethina tumida]
MPIAEVEQLLKKYEQDEEKIESIIKEKNFNKIDDEKKSKQTIVIKDFLTIKEVAERNLQLMKDLETAKGSLRSKAIFSPSEIEWEKICKQYKQELSLPITIWRCNN